MSKVKIYSAEPRNFGTKITFGDLEVKFDSFGCAEVESKEVAEKLATNYPGWLFVGEPQKKEKEKVEKVTDAEFVELANELDRTKERLEAREANIEALKGEVEEWKAQLNIYKERTEKAEAELNEVKEVNLKHIKELELKVGLAEKSVKELIEYCDIIEIPAEKYQNLKKADLITLILDESRGK